MPWTKAIYDRTASDITNRTSNGFFNVIDWVRIYGNQGHLQILMRLLRSVNVPINDLSEPTIATIPSVNDINAFIQNIETLRENACIPPESGILALKHDYVAGSSSVAPDYEDANSWERDLDLLRKYLVTASDYLIYSGVSNSGQIRFWQNHFRQWKFVEASSSPVRLVRSGIAVTGSNLLWQNKFRRY